MAQVDRPGWRTPSQARELRRWREGTYESRCIPVPASCLGRRFAACIDTLTPTGNACSSTPTSHPAPPGSGSSLISGVTSHAGYRCRWATVSCPSCFSVNRVTSPASFLLNTTSMFVACVKYSVSDRGSRLIGAYPATARSKPTREKRMTSCGGDHAHPLRNHRIRARSLGNGRTTKT